MARMNLKLRRDAPGASVFWIVLGIAAAIVLVLGIYLYATGSETRVETEEPEIIAGEGDDVPGTSSFSEGEVATREAEVPAQTDNGAETTDEGVDIEPAEPAAGPDAPAADDADAEAEAGEQQQQE